MIVHGLRDPRQRGRIDRPARLAPWTRFLAPGKKHARPTCSSSPSTSSFPAGSAHADVLVVAPALNSWLRQWLSDEDPARGRAEKRLAALVGELQRTAAHVEGRVGDADPLQAIADALPTFTADRIVSAARSERSMRPIDDLVSRACEPVIAAEASRPIAA